MMPKADVKSACRRVVLVTLVTSMCITKIDDYTLLILRMAFGYSSGPHDWLYIINEPVTGLGNNFLNYPEGAQISSVLPTLIRLVNQIYYLTQDPVVK